MKTAANRRLAALFALILLGTTAQAFAQSSYGHHHSHHGHQGHGFVPAYGFGFGYGPATAAESFLRGKADLVRAYGESNYHHALAQVNWEQARQQAIVNRTAKVEQFFALRKFNEEQRLATIARKRLSKQQLTSLSKKAAPKRLSEANWDPATDGLAWPSALQQSKFAATRVRLDELFRYRRDTTVGLSGDELAEAQQLIEQMTTDLQGRITQVKTTDYTAAKRFLTSLDHEARLNPSTPERLAQN